MENKKRMHWLALLLPKNHGGMGFKDLRLFNQALLARPTGLAPCPLSLTASAHGSKPPNFLFLLLQK